MSNTGHVFSVAAYGESPYLEALLQSLRKQESPSHVIVCTSTPNGHIKGLTEKYGIPLFVRKGVPGLRDDWNFAYEEGRRLGRLVTIAHQDDLYYPAYSRTVLRAFRRYPDMSLFCSRYDTVNAEGKPVYGMAEGVKRLLRFRLRRRAASDRTDVKLSALRWGNGIGCPTCTYQAALCGSPLFQNNYRFVIDWDTLLRLARLPGRFVCVEKALMAYRVHPGAETAKQIHSRNREREEREIFRKLHGRRMADTLMLFYRLAYGAYS